MLSCVSYAVRMLPAFGVVFSALSLGTGGRAFAETPISESPPAEEIFAAATTFTLECATISKGGGVTSNGSILVFGQDVTGSMESASFSVNAGAIPCLAAAMGVDPDAPTRGNDACVGGGNAGQPCAENSDCPGGACQLKIRFISATLPATANAHGVKVNLVAIDSNSVAAPGNYNDTDRWAGAPSLDVGDGLSPSFNAAKLQCAFVSQDWSAVGMIHLYGDVIVPLSSYDVSICTSAAGPCSTALRIGTAKFGDIVTPLVTSQPNFQDIVSIVDKFQNKPTGPSKTRTKLREPVDPAAAVGFLEVSADVDAFKGKTYKQVFSTPPATCP